MKKKYETAIAAAVAYIAIRERTENEVREKLREYDFDKREIDEAITELHESLLLNDEEYAHDFLQTKLAQRPMSIRALRIKMRNHKLDDTLIDETLSQLPSDSDYENAYAEARSFFLSNSSCLGDDKKRCEKILRRLISHGYPFDVARSASEAAFTDINGDL